MLDRITHKKQLTESVVFMCPNDFLQVHPYYTVNTQSNCPHCGAFSFHNGISHYTPLKARVREPRSLFKKIGFNVMLVEFIA